MNFGSQIMSVTSGVLESETLLNYLVSLSFPYTTRCIEELVKVLHSIKCRIGLSNSFCGVANKLNSKFIGLRALTLQKIEAVVQRCL